MNDLGINPMMFDLLRSRGRGAEQLRALAALLEDPGSIPRTRIAADNCLYLPFQGI